MRLKWTINNHSGCSRIRITYHPCHRYKRIIMMIPLYMSRAVRAMINIHLKSLVWAKTIISRWCTNSGFCLIPNNTLIEIIREVAKANLTQKNIDLENTIAIVNKIDTTRESIWVSSKGTTKIINPIIQCPPLFAQIVWARNSRAIIPQKVKLKLPIHLNLSLHNWMKKILQQ